MQTRSQSRKNLRIQPPDLFNPRRSTKKPTTTKPKSAKPKPAKSKPAVTQPSFQSHHIPSLPPREESWPARFDPLSPIPDTLRTQLDDKIDEWVTFIEEEEGTVQRSANDFDRIKALREYLDAGNVAEYRRTSAPGRLGRFEDRASTLALGAEEGSWVQVVRGKVSGSVMWAQHFVEGHPVLHITLSLSLVLGLLVFGILIGERVATIRYIDYLDHREDYEDFDPCVGPFRSYLECR